MTLTLSKNRWPALLGSLAVMFASSAEAGVEFTASLRSETSGARLPALGTSVVKGRVDGDKGRLEYQRCHRPRGADPRKVPTHPNRPMRTSV